MTNRIISIIVILIFSVSASNAQLDLGKKLKEKLKDRVEQKVDKTIDEGLDKAEDEMEGNTEDAEQESDKKVKSPKQKNKKVESEVDEATENKQDKNTQLKSSSKYDFVPGDKIIFFDDFADLAVGDFPVNWETTSSGEVVAIEDQAGKWLQLSGDYSYYAPVLKNFKLPENFTVEFDAFCPEDQDFSLEIFENNTTQINNNYYPGLGGTFIGFEAGWFTWKTYKEGDDNIPEGQSESIEFNFSKKLHYSIWAQKSRLRVYCNQNKYLDIPRGIKNELKLNYLRLANYKGSRMYISNFRVAVGSPDMRNRLLTEGKFITYGITFDSGSDKIKQESASVLKEIAAVLKENSDIKVKIIGHTDSDGNDASNLALSKKRAEAVKIALSSQFGIDAGRMSTDGKGEGEPIAKNDTPQGKAMNRRVEFIKQ